MTASKSSPSPEKGLLIGWELADRKSPMGFTTAPEPAPAVAGRAVTYDGEGHLMTIAPTGAGKGVGCVIPALLRHEGPVVVMDLKGENYAATRRHRREMGSHVTCIDPFGIAQRILDASGTEAEGEVAGFNPFDLLPYLSDDRTTACRSLAEILISPDGHRTDPFWRDAAVGALAALIDCYDRFDGPSRSITAIVQDLSIEVPRARYSGQVSRDVLVTSVIAHDPDIMDFLDGQGLTPDDVWLSYKHSTSHFSGNTLAITGLVETAALMGYDMAQSSKDAKTGDVDGDDESDPDIDGRKASEQVVRMLLGRDAQMSALSFDLATRCSASRDPDLSGFTPEILQRIRERIAAANHMMPRQPVPGSFAVDGEHMEVAENFPLALHHAANTPSQICRALAAQPYTADKTWGSILCTLRADLAQFSGRSISRCFSGEGGLDFEALREGRNISLYIAFPPNRIRSHATLFRVMVEGVLSVIMSRTSRPPSRTLLLLDEIAQLGRIDLLVTAKTLLRGYGVQVWSFWQDISQLKTNYPGDWQTILNNCRVLQVFGRGMGVMASDLSQALNISPTAIADLDQANLMAWIDATTPRTLRRPVSYQDEALRHLSDDGPFALATQAMAPLSPGRRPAHQQKDSFLNPGHEDWETSGFPGFNIGDYPADPSATTSGGLMFLVRGASKAAATSL